MGQDSIDVTIPYKDTGTGKKTMNFKIGVGTRVDEDHLKMKNLQIETFDEAGSSEMTIALPGSILDLNPAGRALIELEASSRPLGVRLDMLATDPHRLACRSLAARVFHNIPIQGL